MPKLLRKETHQRDLLQAGRHRHPPHLVLRLCSPNPPRQTRAKPFPRRRRGKAEQIHPRAAPPPPRAQGPHSPGRDLPGRGSAGAAVPRGRSAQTGGCRSGGGRSPGPRGVPQRGGSARRGAGEPAQPGRSGFPFPFGFLFPSSFKPPPPALGAEPSSGRLQFAL